MADLLGGNIPDIVGNAQNAYHQGVADFQRAADNIRILSSAKQKMQQDQELFDFEKKKQNMALDEARLKGMATESDLAIAQGKMKRQNAMFEQMMKGQNAMVTMEQEKNAAQAKHGVSIAQEAANMLDSQGVQYQQPAPQSQLVQYRPTMSPSGEMYMKEIDQKQWTPKTREEAVGYARDVAAAKSESAVKNQSMGSAARQNKMAKDAESLIGTLETTGFEQQNIDDALVSAERLSKKLAGKGGFLGRVQVATLNQIDPTNELLNDWQTVKGALTNAQLSFTGQTKGAISDKEMGLFSKAVANDDLMSLPRIKQALEKMRRSVDIQKRTKTRYFKSQYGEDKLNEILGGGATENTSAQAPVSSVDLSGMSDEELSRIAGVQ